MPAPTRHWPAIGLILAVVALFPCRTVFGGGDGDGAGSGESGSGADVTNGLGATGQLQPQPGGIDPKDGSQSNQNGVPVMNVPETPKQALQPLRFGQTENPDIETVARVPDGVRIAPSAVADVAPQAPQPATTARADDSVRRADALLEAGRYAEAEQAASDSIARQSGGNPGAFGIRAQARGFLANYRGAQADAQEALRQRPDNPSALQTLGWVLLRQDKVEEAMTAADEAIRRNPQSAVGHAIRAYVADAHQDHWRAKREMERAAELDARFESLARKAKDGKSIYDPTRSDAALLTLALSAESPAPERFPWPRILEALAALAALSIPILLIGRHGRDRWRGAWRPLPSSAAAIEPAGWLGKYRMGSVIGRGGMGVVYEAVDLSLNRSVAIKKMSEAVGSMGDEAREAYLKEAKTVASLHHPAIVDIYEIVEKDREIYLVFELVRGKTLDQVLAGRGLFPLDETLRILRPVCDALEFAHRRELVHRDLKPQNIMLTDEGHVKLMDFGIARVLSSSSSTGAPHRTQTVLGTPAYMAPESWEGVVCKEGDIYALGVCLYEMLTGRVPFSDRDLVANKVRMRFERPSVLVPGLPRPIDEFIARTLEPKLECRVRTAREFIVGLERAAQPARLTPV